MDENKLQSEDVDFISLENFQKISEIVFGNSDLKEIESIDINKIDKDKVALLFSWPLIIAKRYLCPYMELDLFKKQCTLNQLLSNDCDLEQIWNYLALFSSDKDYMKDIKELGNSINVNVEEYQSPFECLVEGFGGFEHEFNFKKILKNIDNDKEPKHKLIDSIFGGKPNSKSNPVYLKFKSLKKLLFTNLIDEIIDCKTTAYKLKMTIVCYYSILFLFLKTLQNKTDKVTISFDDIVLLIDESFDILNDKENLIPSNCVDLLITFGSDLFSEITSFLIKDYKDIFLKNGLPGNSNCAKHQFYKKRPNYIASISRICDENGEENGRNFCISVDREIIISQKMGYKLNFTFRRNLLNNEFTGLVTFKCDNNTDQLKQLMHCLYLIAYRLSITINKYCNQYNNFISDAAASVNNLIDKNLDNFLDNIDDIQNSYYIFNEYLKHKDFSRALENLDMDLAYTFIEEIRSDFKKKKKTHLSPKLIQDLLNANKELILLFSEIPRKRDVNKTKSAKKFFRDNPHHFKILSYDDIKDVDFSYDPNGLRDTRRDIFHAIAARSYKDIAGSRIAKEIM